jgi:nucleotide-binding universal stress UspA family protein
MTLFTHILLPTDGSDLSLSAADTGIALAAKLGARVHAFHVVTPFPAITYFAQMVQLPETVYTDQALARAAEYLAEICRRAAVAGVPCDSSYATDHRPYCAIVGACNKQQCDLIVMASHGLRGFDHLLLGSETHKVILDGNVPVLVCR